MVLSGGCIGRTGIAVRPKRVLHLLAGRHSRSECRMSSKENSLWSAPSEVVPNAILLATPLSDMCGFNLATGVERRQNAQSLSEEGLRRIEAHRESDTVRLDKSLIRQDLAPDRCRASPARLLGLNLPIPSNSALASASPKFPGAGAAPAPTRDVGSASLHPHPHPQK